MSNQPSSDPGESPPRIRPVILCGGSGTRLWPVSRAHFPKQFAAFGGSASLLQRTAHRVSGALFSEPLLVTAEEHRFLVSDQLAEIGVGPCCVLLETKARNTAPAIALAAEWLRQNGKDELMLVLPSDHVIDDEQAFLAAVERAVQAAGSGKLVTFAIAPDRPETGYGYLQVDGTTVMDGITDVRQFVEKPSLEVARQYVEGGDYYWNGGIFLFRATDILEELADHAPEIASWAQAATAGGTLDGLFFRPAEATDSGDCPSISIDYAVMERSDRIAAVIADMGWSDLGSWSEVWSRSVRNGDGNALQGQALVLDGENNLVVAEDGMTVATVGVDDMVVVATQDGVLVTTRDKAQEVRKATEAVKASGWTRTEEPRVVHRPWGTYQVTDQDVRFQTKRIIVKPGARLSSQLHHHRSEHWIVVSGTAEVTVGDDTFMLFENQSTYINAGTVHRLANPGKVPLHLVEVQCGSYLGEDDIVRFDDIYGRAGQQG